MSTTPDRAPAPETSGEDLTIPAIPDVVVDGELFARLVPAHPMNQDEQGGCVWCGGSPLSESTHRDGPDPSLHEADCPWVAARRLVDATVSSGGEQFPRPGVAVTRPGREEVGIVHCCIDEARDLWSVHWGVYSGSGEYGKDLSPAPTLTIADVAQTALDLSDEGRMDQLLWELTLLRARGGSAADLLVSIRSVVGEVVR